MADTEELEPCYIDINGFKYEYYPPNGIAPLSRFNIAKCMRDRMAEAYDSAGVDLNWYERWADIRKAFWSTVARSLPEEFK